MSLAPRLRSGAPLRLSPAIRMAARLSVSRRVRSISARKGRLSGKHSESVVVITKNTRREWKQATRCN